MNMNDSRLTTQLRLKTGVSKRKMSSVFAIMLFISSLQFRLLEAVAFTQPPMTYHHRHSLTQHEIHYSSRSQLLQRRRYTNLFATSSNEPSEKSRTTTTTRTSKSARERGIYARPSAAIERGSGFFVPGLEGPRIRVLFGITVLVVDAANHVFAESQEGDYGQVIAEVLAAFYGAFLLLQGLIESAVAERGVAKGVNDLFVGRNGDDDVDADAIKGFRSSGFSTDIEGSQSAPDIMSMKRLARTIINFTPATHFLVANAEDGILYRYGSWDDSDSTDNDEKRGIIQLALDAVGSSRAGRVALPSEHPVSKMLPISATRCILVQSVDGYGSGGKSCLIIGSDKLLPAYTKNDLRWIGQLVVQPEKI